MKERRNDRISSIVHKAISDIIQLKLDTKDIGFITVTKTEVTNDLSFAYVYVSILNDKNGSRLAMLENRKAFIRGELAKEVVLRKIPNIIFKIDDSVDNYMHIQDLINTNKKK